MRWDLLLTTVCWVASLVVRKHGTGEDGPPGTDRYVEDLQARQHSLDIGRLLLLILISPLIDT
jgi:hypothetical protein